MLINCKICNNSENNKYHQAKEMMFGLGDYFDYMECKNCGCVQIINIPTDMSKYYPKEYYSLDINQEGTLSFKTYVINSINKYINNRLNVYAFKNKGLIDKILYKKYPYDSSQAMRSLHHIKFKNKQASILDVGCGSGDLIKRMHKLGFKKVSGIDPFLKEDVHYESGVSIYKEYITDVKGEFDLIMFHHSFEHIPNPAETLSAVQKLMSPNGLCLIRIPVADSFAFKYYNTNWVEFDAPRHFFLHTTKSMQILAQNAGLSIEQIIYDSTEFQFIGSEQYLRGIPLLSKNSYLKGYKKNFSKQDVSNYVERSKELNNNKQGGRAIFLLKRTI